MPFRPDPQQPAAPVGRFRPDPPAADAGGPRRYSAKNEPSYLDEYGQGVENAGRDVAAGAEASSIPKVLQPIVGAAEGALSLATGAIAPVPGAVQSALTGRPYTEARDSYVYEPRTLPGKSTMGTVGALAKPAVDLFEGASGGVEDFAEYLGASPETAEQIAAPVMDIGTAAIPTRLARPKKPPLKVESTAPTEGRQTLAEMRAKGIKVTPAEASKITGDKNYGGRFLQAIGGDTKVTKDIAAQNAPVLNEMARKAVGSDSLTEQGLKPVKEHGNAVYNEMAALGPVEPEPALLNAIEQARGSANKSTKRNTDIDRFVDGVLAEYQSGAVDAGQIVNRVRELRRDAANSRKGEGDKRPTVQQEALGEAQRKVADALDDFLELNAATAGKPELAQKYKENRVRLAKVGTVEGASRAGNINAKQLYDESQKGAPLSGNLKGIATANEYAPGSTAPTGTESLLEAPGRNLGLGELFVAGGQNVVRHMGVNKLLQSDWYQNLLAGQKPGSIPLEHDPNPNAFRPPMRQPEAAPTEIPQTNASSMLRAQQLAGDLSLADDVPNPEQLPPAPDRLTADVPPAPSGDLPFQPQDLGAMIESALSAQTPQAQGSLPGGNVRGIMSALGLAEDAPVNAGPARRVGPDDGIPFEAVSPEEVGPYRINTDLNFNDARPVSGAQRGAAVGGAGDLELVPDPPPGPYQQLPPSPGRPRRQGPPRIRQPAPATPPAPAEAPPPEGLSELGALIDEMLRTPNPRQMQNPSQLQQASIVPGTIAEALGVSPEAFPDRYMVPGSKRISESPDEGYIAYEPKDGRRQINDAFVKAEARGKGLGQKNLVKLAKEAQEAGEALDSDVSITPAQARAYLKAREKGQLDFDITDQKAWDEALANGTNVKAGGQPVVKNIRPVASNKYSVQITDKDGKRKTVKIEAATPAQARAAAKRDGATTANVLSSEKE